MMSKIMCDCAKITLSSFTRDSACVVTLSGIRCITFQGKFDLISVMYFTPGGEPSNQSGAEVGDCEAAQASITNVQYNIVRAVQTVTGLVITVLLLRIVWFCKTHPVKLHANLVSILISVFLLYAIFVWSFIVAAAWHFYLALTYSDPCDCLSPVWLVYVVRMPFYMYIAGSPMLHLAIMVERVRATLFVHSYERAGTKFAIGILAIVVVLVTAFCVYVYFSSIIDPTFERPMIYFTLTGRYNATELLYVHYFFLLLVICISIADYFLIRMNRRLKRTFSNKVQDYSLSRNYQTNENILTMRIIFPLDFSYTIFFSIFNILSGYIRIKREQFGILMYIRTYEAITLQQDDSRYSPEDCLAAEESTNGRAYNIVRAAQLLLALITNLLLIKIVLYYRRSLITLHSNLLVLALTYSDPCDCLSPVWLVYVVRMPFYAYIAGSPLLHFGIMVERVRATVFVRDYEKEGRKFGIGIFIFMKMLTLAFCAYVYGTSKMDTELTGKPMVYFTLTSKFNSSQLIYVHYFFLFLVICISIADYALIRMNNKLKSKFSNKVQDYSLSRNYQTNENILTMRIIFPLDLSYTIFFSIFNILSGYIRIKREQFGILMYIRTYEAITLVRFYYF
uniref:G protein-coupled receptor n=1 Tax=Globodera pallida TaxID=36090 RepID=A0A183C7Q1_GLOPA